MNCIIRSFGKKKRKKKNGNRSRSIISIASWQEVVWSGSPFSSGNFPRRYATPQRPDRADPTKCLTVYGPLRGASSTCFLWQLYAILYIKASSPVNKSTAVSLHGTHQCTFISSSSLYFYLPRVAPTICQVAPSSTRWPGVLSPIQRQEGERTTISVRNVSF